MELPRPKFACGKRSRSKTAFKFFLATDVSWQWKEDVTERIVFNLAHTTKVSVLNLLAAVSPKEKLY